MFHLWEFRRKRCKNKTRKCNGLKFRNVGTKSACNFVSLQTHVSLDLNLVDLQGAAKKWTLKVFPCFLSNRLEF